MRVWSSSGIGLLVQSNTFSTELEAFTTIVFLSSFVFIIFPLTSNWNLLCVMPAWNTKKMYRTTQFIEADLFMSTISTWPSLENNQSRFLQSNRMQLMSPLILTLLRSGESSWNSSLITSRNGSSNLATHSSFKLKSKHSGLSRG